MNYQSMALATCLVAVVLAGCSRSRPVEGRVQADTSAQGADKAAADARPDSPDKRVVALVSWLKRKGVTLELTGAAEDHSGWKVTRPKTSDEYDVVFHIRSFPASASEEQMRQALDVNLAY